MNRIDRLFGILTLLQSRKFVPAEKIAEKFGISVRTVYRDVKALCEQGIPVSFEQNRGYFVVQGFFLPPVSFNATEANALLLTEALAYGFADKSIQEHYTSALNKIKAVMRNSDKEKLESLTENIKLQLPARLNQDSGYLSQIQLSITERTVMVLQYISQSEQTSSREIEPIGLVFYAFSWHLIAWCHLRNDYRDFKVSRIQGLRSSGNPFRKQDHIPLSDYMKELPVDY
jgi:predicted DNA-binding transcriptional regulator YafY